MTEQIVTLEQLCSATGQPNLCEEDLWRFQSAVNRKLDSQGADFKWERRGKFALLLVVYSWRWKADEVVQQVLDEGGW